METGAQLAITLFNPRFAIIVSARAEFGRMISVKLYFRAIYLLRVVRALISIAIADRMEGIIMI
jgi:hypothetical protein